MADHGSVLPVAKGNWESTVSLLQKDSNVSAEPTTLLPRPLFALLI